VPFDNGGAIRSGSRFGPTSIREQSKLYLRSVNRYFNLSPFDSLKVVDYGDVPIIPELIEESYNNIQSELNKIYESDTRPIILGGDHSISLPALRSAFNRYGTVSLLHFDAHLDIVDSYYDGKVKYNNGTVFRRAVEEGLVDTEHSVQIGMNGSIFDGMQKSESELLGFTVIPIEEARQSLGSKLNKTINNIIKRKPVYISFDIDVMDLSVAPGSGAPEVGGFLTWEILNIIRNLRGINLIGVDIVEVNPLFDTGDITSILAANLAFEFLTLLALNQK
jgi:agmatinase